MTKVYVYSCLTMTERRKRLHADVSLEEVTRLYRDEDWTAERIAKKYGVWINTVFGWLREAGVPRRIAARQPFKADPEHLKDLYNRQKLSLKEIGKQFGVDEMTVLRFFRRHGIPRRPRGHFRNRKTSC
jgi:Transposase.